TLLFGPGKTPIENLRFATFVVNALMAVYKHNGLLKASIMSATNAHRLGANEAPPAIISSFLGKHLDNMLDTLEGSVDESVLLSGEHTGLNMNIAQIPEIVLDNTDRNRTSPFAFTGNRFEFRAVGSQANCACAMIVLNTAVAEQLTEFKAQVDALIASGETKVSALIRVLRRWIKECKAIRFEGNGYSDEWKEEAKARGLDCETSCPLIFDHYLSADSVAMFEKMGVMTSKELAARNEVKWETYTKKLQIESRVLGDLAMNHIIPIANEYQSKLIDSIFKIKSIFPAEKAEELSKENYLLVEKIAKHTTFITENVELMVNARKAANKITSEREKAIVYHDIVEMFFGLIRYHIDNLELIVDDRMWTLPKYRELLHI
ncbi:MAG: glutamine synthetase type III, partial [Bacteroidaceae bacterium]|nr:glutamine synthetase type III [Bacteroidaceae bacterium]